MHRIVFTRPGSLVSVVCPADRALRIYAEGAGPNVAKCGTNWYWNARRGRGWLSLQIDRQVAAGHDPDVARRHVLAMTFGGLTTNHGLALICDRDCKNRGTGIELWSIAEVPVDRWFRNAWRRATDGGPIWIDLEAAKLIQQAKVVRRIDGYNARQRARPDLWGHNGPQLLDVDFAYFKRRCSEARSLDQLQTVWPAELMQGEKNEYSVRRHLG